MNMYCRHNTLFVRTEIAIIAIIAMASVPWHTLATPISNGATVQSAISVPGGTEQWTFNATNGDAIIVRIGEITNATFVPKIQLLAPDSTVVGSSSGTVVAEVVVTATNFGTYTIVVSDGSVNGNLTAGYRLSLAKTGDPVTVSAGDEGGPMTNGVMHLGTVLTGELDVWTITATAGDSIVVRMGQITDTNTFYTWARLYGPNGKLLDSSDVSTVAEVSALATNTGTFLVVVADGNGGLFGSGDYRLTLAKTGDPVVVSPGDDGGPMTNGVMHTGTILTGDLDLWTFTAAAGDNIMVRMGRITDTNTFYTWVRLYGPNGKLLDSSDVSTVAEVSTLATNTGTFLVVVGDGNGGLFGSGDYRLTLAKTGDPVVVSPGDDGGPMTNGVMHTGTILTGDLDLWTFTATAGDNIVVRMGQITDTNTFYTWVRLYGPNGALLGSLPTSAVSEVATRATNSGTFMVVVGDGNGGLSGSGDYRLTLAKTGNPVVVSPGDDGGPMTNGLTHTGTILPGDLDLWTFTAATGDNIILRMGQITDTNTFYPWVRLYGPNGVFLGNSSASGVAEEVSTRATNSGTFLVVVGDGNGGLFGSGDYRLTLAKTGSSLAVSPGDEGGALTAGNNPQGVITTGDIDVYSFTTCKGEFVSLKLDELVDGSGNFAPWLRVYGPNGVLLGSVSGTTTAQVTLTATNSGTFIVVISDGNGLLSGTGTYQLTSNGLSDELRLCLPIATAGNLNLSAVGGPADGTYILLTATNITLPGNLWAPIRTNLFDDFGVFSFTNSISLSETQRFFRVVAP